MGPFLFTPEGLKGLSGISSNFLLLSQIYGQVTHVLLTHPPLFLEVGSWKLDVGTGGNWPQANSFLILTSNL